MNHIGTILADSLSDNRRHGRPEETNVARLPIVTGAPSASLKRAIEVSTGRDTSMRRGWTDGRDVTVSPADVREAQARLRALEDGDLREAGPEVPETFMLEMTDLLPSTENLRNSGHRISRYIEHLSRMPVACFTQQSLMHILRASMRGTGAFLLSYPEIETILLASIQPQRDLAAGLRAVISAGRRQQCNDRLLQNDDRPIPESAARTVTDLEQMPASKLRAQIAQLYCAVLEDKTPQLVEQYGPRLRRLLAAAPVSTVKEQLRVLAAQTTPEDRAEAKRAYLSRQQIDAAYAAARGEVGTTPVTTDSVGDGNHRITDGGPTGGVRRSTCP
jgi:hypothetical protein